MMASRAASAVQGMASRWDMLVRAQRRDLGRRCAEGLCDLGQASR